MRVFFFIAAVMLLSVIGMFVFIALPGQIDTPRVNVDSTPVGSTSDNRSAASASDDNALPPFQASERERARTRAQARLGDFVELQMMLEDEMSVEIWGMSEYGEILERANEADQRFLEGKFEQALTEYDSATASLEALIEIGSGLYEQAVVDGSAALDIRDQTAALESFQRALAIRPEDPDASAGMERAEKIPQVLELFRQSERAELRGDMQQARAHLTSIKSIDPLTPGVDARLAKFNAVLSEARYQETLSAGFAALEQGRFTEAQATFDKVLSSRPDDPVALAGKQQTQQNQTLARIDRIKERAAEQESLGNWDEALSDYVEALEIDKSLLFAREGRTRLRDLIRTIDAMDRYLDDPPILSSDDEFNQAQTVLAQAMALIGQTNSLDSKTQAFSELLTTAARPIPIVLVSDSETDVMIHKIGQLGVFDRHEIELRPGRYTVVGSADGCVDVRKTIIVAPAMAPVTIQCEKRI